MFIRASRETHSGELVLIVRPNGESTTKTQLIKRNVDSSVQKGIRLGRQFLKFAQDSYLVTVLRLAA